MDMQTNVISALVQEIFSVIIIQIFSNHQMSIFKKTIRIKFYLFFILNMVDKEDLTGEIPSYAFIALARRGMEKISLDQCFLKKKKDFL